jgi:predicted N-acetyltransferase YhbS
VRAAQDPERIDATDASFCPMGPIMISVAEPVAADPPLFTTRPVLPTDDARLSELHRAAFGPGRFARTAYRVREGTGLASRFCRVVMRGEELVAAIRFAEITIGGVGGAVLLGPLAVAPAYANQGHGRRLIAEGLDAARAAGVKLCLLVGDVPYYGRLGFKVVPPGQITLPGPADPARLLAFEFEAGSLTGFRGLVAAVRG